MKLFALITLLSAFLLTLSSSFHKTAPKIRRTLPMGVQNLYPAFKKSFQNPQNANLLWSFLTGQKKQISPKLQKSFNDLELGFLFSPSGIHFGAFLTLLFLFKKKSKCKKLSLATQGIISLLALFLPYMAIKRIAILKLLIFSQRFLKKRMPIEFLFLLTFCFSFLLGHYRESPLGFILSFLYMGTFISLRDHSKRTNLIGLFSSHLLIAFFSGHEMSPIALILNIPIIALFSLILPFFYLYFLSFQWINFNWIEIGVRIFILMIQEMAKFTQGTFVSSTFFLMLAVWVILLKKQKRYLLLFLSLHGNIIHAPTIF